MAGRIVLGLGGTVDYELVWDARMFQELVDGHGICLAEVGEAAPSRVGGERGIVLTVLRYMRRGEGGECYVADKRALLAFADRFAYEVTLGGTCVRAALAMDRIGVASTVHLVSINEHVRRLLPDRVGWVCSAQADSLDPHVIVQYPVGAVVHLTDGEVTARRPNRVIAVNDAPNERLRLSAELPRLLAAAQVVLISGFNTMKSAAELRVRLAEVEAALAAVAPGAVVVYEDAGFHDGALREVVLETTARLVHLHSLNEDEAQQYLGRTVDLADAGQVTVMMSELHRWLGAPAVMVHTSRYAAVVGERASLLRAAAEAGCLMASTRFLHGDRYGMEEYGAVARAPRDEIGIRLTASPEASRAGVLIAPGFDVRTDSPTTIGLGDAFIGGVVAHLARAQ
ncbi:ADP-dependent glucokinase/phosphofructokinase [Actinomyces sp.]|uniref:ADP-dependent glucokinase/phosphofructokinase n=1 Tax=Actinomyces sp. TaxID=29317 RepID=UPI0026DBE9B1|nr:ADP-dependent glucokinase/phosphofructokinase [Actinomyces sp.]MDO4901180.1 ADP-dependent glucokinase/phosphofructokinase [Actinomyces sp.]